MLILKPTGKVILFEYIYGVFKPAYYEVQLVICRLGIVLKESDVN